MQGHKVNLKEAVEIYNTGKTLQEVSEHYGVGRQAIHSLFRHYGIPTRTIKEAHKLRSNRLKKKVWESYLSGKNIHDIVEFTGATKDYVRDVLLEDYKISKKEYRARKKGNRRPGERTLSIVSLYREGHEEEARRKAGSRVNYHGALNRQGIFPYIEKGVNITGIKTNEILKIGRMYYNELMTIDEIIKKTRLTRAKVIHRRNRYKNIMNLSE